MLNSDSVCSDLYSSGISFIMNLNICVCLARYCLVYVKSCQFYAVVDFVAIF